MRFPNSSAGQADGGEELARPHRPGRFGARRLAVAAGVAVALAGAFVGVDAARAIPASHGWGTPTSRAAISRHAAAARTSGSAESGSPASTGAWAAGSARGAGTAGEGTNRPKTRRTSCQSVAHVGDSTSVDLISPAVLPNPAERITARYAQVGVRHLTINASGGRSIVEELLGQLNGYKVASAWRTLGYHGCWVFALGTNDAADVAAGSKIGMMARIDQMMAAAHGGPVMWVNTRTFLSTGPYASANERAWDKTLVRALAKYPNMRIFDWSAIARPAWFLADGIHYNSLGCAMRAKAIADALARAFPLHGRSAAQIVR
jgi:hypothetical protein